MSNCNWAPAGDLEILHEILIPEHPAAESHRERVRGALENGAKSPLGIGNRRFGTEGSRDRFVPGNQESEFALCEVNTNTRIIFESQDLD
jgi:hypothetical protein